MKDDVQVVNIIKACLNQMINFDPSIDDTAREWWYVSPLYAEDQKIPDMPVSELEGRIKALKFTSIKEVSSFKIFDRTVIQVRGNREEIIKECELHSKLVEILN